MQLLRRLPLVLILVLAWAALRLSGCELTLGDPISWALVIACFSVTLIEFYKSGDITLTSFKFDLAFAVIATVVTAALVTHFWGQGVISVPDFFITVSVLADAFLSPVNSFRSALRNVQAGINTAPTDA